MKLTVIDQITNERESVNLNFTGRLADHLPHCNINECLHNGQPAELDSLVVDQHSNVILYVTPDGDPITLSVIGAFVIKFAISSIISLAIGMIFRKKPQKPTLRRVRRKEESPTYAFEGISDTLAPGSPIPFILGLARKGGQIISTRVELVDDGKKQKLFMLLGMGWGEANSIANVQLNGSELTNFKDVTTQTRPGTLGQTVISGFETIDQTYFDGRDFTDSSITYTTKGDVERVDLFIGALQGLFHNTDTGNFRTNDSVFRVEFRVAGGGGFTLDTEATISGKTTNAKFEIHTLILPAKDTYDIKLTWVSAKRTDENQSQWRLSLHNVVERLFETRTYPEQILLAIEAVTTAELNGQIPTVTANVEMLHEIPGSGFVPTQNNAWAIRDCIKDDRWGIGHRIPASWIDEPSWLAFAVYCDEQVEAFDGGTENRHQISYVGDVKRKAWDLIHELLSMCDASMPLIQGKLTIVIDKAKTASQLYGEANTIPGSLSISYGRAERRHNTINGKYFDEENGYTPDFVKALDTAALATESSKTQDLDLIGVSRQSEAIRAVERQLRENVLRFKQYAWESPSEAIVAVAGDVVKAQYFVANFERGHTGYILAGQALDEIILDKTVTLASGKTYEIFIRHKDTNVFVQKVVDSPAGEWGRLKLTTNLTQAATEGDLYGIGEQSVGIVDVLVTDVTQKAAGTYQITADNYDPDVYTLKALPPRNIRGTIAVGDVPPLPIENFTVRENIDIQPDGAVDTRLEFDIIPGMLVNPGQSLGATASTIDLSVDEPDRDDFFLNATIQIIGGTGNGQSRKILSYDGTLRRVDQLDSNWLVRPDSTSLYQIIFATAGEYYGAAVEISEAAITWTELGTFIGAEGSLPISGQGNEISIRVIPFTVTGQRNTNALLSVALTVSGTDVEPTDIADYSVVQIADRVLHTWPGIPDTDLAYYEIRAGATWEQSVLVETGILTNFWETSNFTAGAKNYLIKAFDRTGNESINAASFAITLVEPNNRITFLLFDELAAQGGVFTDMVPKDIGGGASGLGLASGINYDSGETWDSGLFWDGDTVLVGSYQSEVQTIGTVSLARIAADIGFLNSVGAMLLVEEQHSNDGISYTPWRIIGAGDQQWKFARLRITLTADTPQDDPVINKFNIIIDALVRGYRGINVSILAAGTTQVFPAAYINTPSIIPVPVGGTATKAKIESQDNTQFTMKLYNDSDVAVAGNANWTSEGI